MSRYVAFNPSSSEDSEFVEGNSLREIVQTLGSRGYLNAESYVTARGSLRREGIGRWIIESIEVYDLTLHPRLREQVNQWRAITA